MIISTKGYGSTLGCPALDDVLQRLKIGLNTAEGSSNLNMSDLRYALARQFYGSNTGFFSSSWVAIGAACTNLIDEANTRLSDLNSLLSDLDLPQVPASKSGQPSGGGLFDFGGSTPWILGGIGIVVTLGVIGYTVRAFR